MLIIAQPKSASTSLLKTLAMILKLKYRNGLGKTENNELCEGFEEIQKYHGTTVKRSFKFLKNWIEKRDIIYKEHILPTDEHINYIKKINKPIIIMLRNPEHSIDNYKRLLKDKLSEKNEAELKRDVLKTINMDLLEKDIKEFNRKWKEVNLKCALYIDFDYLIMNPWHACKRIVEHFGFKMPKLKKFALLKAKGNHGYNTYTGIGLQRLLNKYKKESNINQ